MPDSVYPQVLNFTFSRFALTFQSLCLVNLSDITSNIFLSYSRSPYAHTTLHFTSIAFIVIYISIYLTLKKSYFLKLQVFQNHVFCLLLCVRY